MFLFDSSISITPQIETRLLITDRMKIEPAMLGLLWELSWYVGDNRILRLPDGDRTILLEVIKEGEQYRMVLYEREDGKMFYMTNQ